MRTNRVKQRRVVHKSAAGILNSIPEAVDLVGNSPPALTNNTVAHPARPEILRSICVSMAFLRPVRPECIDGPQPIGSKALASHKSSYQMNRIWPHNSYIRILPT